jgi:tRNA(fMet)-specific endonuclease VapC
LEVKKILLDTNAYSALLQGDEKVLEAMAKAETVYMSVFVMGELFAGFRGGNRFADNRQQLERFLERPHVALLPVGLDVADVFGSVKQQLKKQGMPIPINDVWIASHAMEIGAVLITYDRHFHHVAGLRVWDEL